MNVPLFCVLALSCTILALASDGKALVGAREERHVVAQQGYSQCSSYATCGTQNGGAMSCGTCTSPSVCAIGSDGTSGTCDACTPQTVYISKNSGGHTFTVINFGYVFPNNGVPLTSITITNAPLGLTFNGAQVSTTGPTTLTVSGHLFSGGSLVYSTTSSASSSFSFQLTYQNAAVSTVCTMTLSVQGTCGNGYVEQGEACDSVGGTVYGYYCLNGGTPTCSNCWVVGCTGGSLISVVYIAYSFIDAETMCSYQLPGGALISLHSAAETTSLTNQLSFLPGGFWLRMGLVNTPSGWMWSDGTAMDYTNWDGTSPTCSQNCAYSSGCGQYHHADGTWSQIPCQAYNDAFICRVASGCTPATTCTGGATCGHQSNGCGGITNCGSCSSPSTCQIGSDGTSGVCSTCFDVTSGIPTYTIAPLNTTYLQQTISLPLGWFVMNASSELNVVGTDPSCTGVNVLNTSTQCTSPAQVQCLIDTTGFVYQPSSVAVDYVAGRIVYTYQFNPSDPNTRAALGIYMNNTVLYSDVQVCQLLPETQFGVDLPFSLSNYHAVHPANMECHNIQQSTDVEMNTETGTLTIINAQTRIEIAVNGYLSWSINETIYVSCSFSVSPPEYNNYLVCGATSCKFMQVYPSYTMNISANCILLGGQTSRNLPLVVVNDMQNQYFTSYLTSAPVNGAIYIYGSTDVYTVILPYYIAGANVSGPGVNIELVLNDAAVNNGGMHVLLSSNSNGQRNLTFIPGALLPGAYTLSLAMLFTTPTGRKFIEQEATVDGGSGGEDRTFTVTMNSAGSAPTKQRSNTAEIIGIIIGVIGLLIAVCIGHQLLKRYRRSQVASNPQIANATKTLPPMQFTVGPV